ncbi:MAG: DUF3465 domain-containing protein [Planctomycetota bacterium]|nr:DUF3465 domain-containing protein [Planctomycetota bacterium]
MSETSSKGKLGGAKGLLAIVVVVGALIVQKFTGIDLLGQDKGDTVDQRGQATETADSRANDPAPSAKAQDPAPKAKAPTQTPPKTAPKTDNGVDYVYQQFKAQRSSVWVTTEGKVVHLLADDNEGSRHQQFLLELDEALDFTGKVAHNIDDAPYITTLKKGDTIQIQGRYEYNEKGGVIHFTHRADRPTKRKPGGWIDHKGKRYQ